MEQSKLFPERYESFLEALRDDVNALGGPSEIGEWFWKEKSHETRRNLVNHSLNSERRERFTQEQEQLIMRRAREKRGYSAALYFLCDETGFERPKAIQPEDEKLKVARALATAIAGLGELVGRAEALGVKIEPGVRVIK